VLQVVNSDTLIVLVSTFYKYVLEKQERLSVSFRNVYRLVSVYE